MFYSCMIISLLTFLIILILTMISKKMKINFYKSSPFECGFMNMSSPRKSFSINFFFIAIMFLIFDTEISIILPFMYMKMLKMNECILSFILIMLTISLGLYMEWNQGLIEWKF
uniref:NADH dehydrogenase subunit 3 n=1 Tax=Nisia atrovenosa TaxID=1187023 RepID=UPI002A804889|nr:NADH dehydrogenase subunit 3 [Nisia atrovenosa]WOW98924.1 NADH dehydrogenase subunit 3 [Nisia atrovenosa]